jgi:hypothetical protein
MDERARAPRAALAALGVGRASSATEFFLATALYMTNSAAGALRLTHIF